MKKGRDAYGLALDLLEEPWPNVQETRDNQPPRQVP